MSWALYMWGHTGYRNKMFFGKMRRRGVVGSNLLPSSTLRLVSLCSTNLRLALCGAQQPPTPPSTWTSPETAPYFRWALKGPRNVCSHRRPRPPEGSPEPTLLACARVFLKGNPLPLLQGSVALKCSWPADCKGTRLVTHRLGCTPRCLVGSMQDHRGPE